ncbi:cryptochrome/photolyase family protein [Kiritimatiella glycovorans]|uniref:Deoxyribodipyrimidine photo-lyase-related protein n=1 Tax=Kiritimatiella glycovorans TaxID=1307763 RepID=A0A0G3EE03_9BACT|nr:cryptochrome/photolyase family protein [Kiritimatiella glycovorans]AKJ63647.1 Deoxyribodipyrimidine photo-lyase-related protein [Kiritimatiella glycovorans]
MSNRPHSVRHLVVVLGDQLDAESAAFDGFDPRRDRVWMAEAVGEAEYVRSHKVRLALFFSAMRHFADELKQRGRPVTYHELDPHDARSSLAGRMTADLRDWKPERVIGVEPGEHRVREDLTHAAHEAGIPVEWRSDRHFLCPREVFDDWAEGRKTFRQEHFYRMMRRRTGVLMDGEEPVGGMWNYDAENRASFGREGPPDHPSPPAYRPDAITREVLELVARRFGGHPGSLDAFAWPVTRAQALDALQRFVRERLASFGRYQDAMWTGEPYLWHSLLSSSLNLHLLRPHEVLAAATAAFRDGVVPAAAAEGFVRQILGWREYVRGIYHRFMPEYAQRNALGADRPLPEFYWTGETAMACLREAIGQTLSTGYAHHIQRLMITGLYSLLLGVRPKEIHEWYLAIYLDAVEWVELPNVLGMSQYADGGLLASKPYAAGGAYIRRMSNYCRGCRYRPDRRTGDDACPFTRLYWAFLDRHRRRLKGNPRMSLALRNLDRIPKSELREIRKARPEKR